MCVRPYFFVVEAVSVNPFTFLFALMQKESDKEKNQGLRLRCYSDKAISGRS
jgi:hypothetical protein